ncbi:MAG TPA: acetyl-CoA C-acyltransferase, partial [Candidatus Polarisedimenticolaceae bacterium]|nr:acetyl-CoA C-acyltransferase [Candidatus Polarisedimenticolaceae bacterium]
MVLAGAVRTPIGKFGGTLARFSAVELAAVAGREALRRAGLQPGQVDEAVMGQARQAGSGPNPGRQTAIACGIPVEKPAYTINQACLSGMQAILAARRSIRLGEAEVVLALGTEAMSRVPYLLDTRWGTKMGDRRITDAMYQDGFLDPMSGKLMGETAETLAQQYGISRQEQDAYAAESQNRAEAAWRDGRFTDEVVPVEGLARDEHPREGVTAASLAKLPPVFDKDGTVSAGNSSGITDGAAALVVLSRNAARRLGVPVLARIVDAQVAGVEPAVMGIGPVPAVRRLLERTGKTLDEIDLVELNEAFAAQVLAVDRELGFDRTRLNVNGGSIALGHPIGCSGARIVVTLLHALGRHGGRFGLATLCVSGGLGGALLLER